MAFRKAFTFAAFGREEGMYTYRKLYCRKCGALTPHEPAELGFKCKECGKLFKC
jgi:tRNA(Ile2) C34 agmatinyltransferase TiaS